MEGTDLEITRARMDVLEMVICQTLSRRDPTWAKAQDEYLRGVSEHLLNDPATDARGRRQAQAAIRFCDLLGVEIALAEKAQR